MVIRRKNALLPAKNYFENENQKNKKQKGTESYYNCK